MSLQWYALRSKPNKEEALWLEADARGFEIFYPRIRVQPINPRSRKVRSYFPGYMFVHVDLPSVGPSAFQWMPYSYGLVTLDAEPSSVPEELIHALQRRVEVINAAGGEKFDGLKRGEKVTILGGPFAGYEALFDACLPGQERVRVLLKLLEKRLVPLELPAGLIQHQARY